MPIFGRGRRRNDLRFTGTQIVRTGKVKSYPRREFWNDEISTLSRVETEFGYSLTNFIRKRFARNNHSKGTAKPVVVLDWGCGAGIALHMLDEIFGRQVELYGFSKDHYAEWSGNSKNIAFIQETANNSPRFFKERSIDLIYSFFGINHLLGSQNFYELLGQLLKKLSKKGRFVISRLDRKPHSPLLLLRVKSEASKNGVSIKIRKLSNCLIFERTD